MASERRYVGVSVGGSEDGDWAFVDVTERTQTPEQAREALLEAAEHEWGMRLVGEFDGPTRHSWCWLNGEVGNDQHECEADDPAKVGEWWRFDISMVIDEAADRMFDRIDPQRAVSRERKP